MERKQIVARDKAQIIGNFGSPHGRVQVNQGEQRLAQGHFVERHLPFLVGLGLILVATALVFAFGTPTALQTRIVIGVFALGGGALATELSGMIKVNLKLGTQLAIGATGALAIFVILYFKVPA